MASENWIHSSYRFRALIESRAQALPELARDAKDNPTLAMGPRPRDLEILRGELSSIITKT
jgi:hypothetical protein